MQDGSDRDQRRARVTTRQAAELAGVPIATVSRVVNGAWFSQQALQLAQRANPPLSQHVG